VSDEKTLAKKLETLELGQRCKQSIATLKAHRRSADKEHAERAKKIQAVEDAISGHFQRGDLELPGFDSLSFPPETLALVYNPLGGH
jgi:hypothetical protein